MRKQNIFFIPESNLDVARGIQFMLLYLAQGESSRFYQDLIVGDGVKHFMKYNNQCRSSTREKKIPY